MQNPTGAPATISGNFLGEGRRIHALGESFIMSSAYDQDGNRATRAYPVGEPLAASAKTRATRLRS